MAKRLLSKKVEEETNKLINSDFYYSTIVEAIEPHYDDLQDLVNIQLALNKISNEVQTIIMSYYISGK